MLTGDATDLSRCAEGMRLATRPFRVSPLAAVEALSDGVAALGVVVAPLAPEASFGSERDRVEGTEEALYGVTSLFLAPSVGLDVVPDDPRVDAPVRVGLRESTGRVV